MGREDLTAAGGMGCIGKGTIAVRRYRGDYEDSTHGRFHYKLPVDMSIRMIKPGYRPNILC